MHGEPRNAVSVRQCDLANPQLRYQQSEPGALRPCEPEALPLQQRTVIDQSARLQPCRDFEKQIQHSQPCPSPYRPPSRSRLTEFRDHPASPWKGRLRDLSNDPRGVTFVKAIEKKVGDDQIIRSAGKRIGAGVGLRKTDPPATFPDPHKSQVQHPLAQIHIIDFCLRILFDQGRQESSIALAHHQNPPGIRGVTEKSRPATLQLPSESYVLEPAVPSRDGIAIHARIPARGRNRIGLSKATSARTRRASRVNRCRPRSRSARPRALAASAPLSTGRW